MPRTPTPKAKPTAATSLLEQYKDFEGIKVIERRFKEPDQPGSLPIRLADEPSQLEDPRGAKRKWYLRWINGGQEGRYAQITDGMGYVPVRVSELRNRDAITGIFRDKDDADPVVRRGDRGQEVLVKMPLDLYNEIKRRQHEMRTRRGTNATRVKADLADLAGATLGDEAGETIANEFTVEMRQRKSTLGAEIAGAPDFDEDRA